MCLRIETKDKDLKPSIATKDMVVYKHLWVSSTEQYLTSYQQCEVDFNVLITSNIGTYWSVLVDKLSIDVGIHSFACKGDCIADAMEEIESGRDINIIARCIIPEGSKYYIGTFGDRKSYASSQIIYEKIVKHL